MHYVVVYPGDILDTGVSDVDPLKNLKLVMNRFKADFVPRVEHRGARDHRRRTRTRSAQGGCTAAGSRTHKEGTSNVLIGCHLLPNLYAKLFSPIVASACATRRRHFMTLVGIRGRLLKCH